MTIEQQIEQQFKDVKFQAWANGFTELLEYLEDAKLEYYWLSDSASITSPYEEQLNMELCEIDTPDFIKKMNNMDCSYAAHCKALKEMRKIEDLKKLIVRQGRKCGLTFPRSYIGFGKLKLKRK